MQIGTRSRSISDADLINTVRTVNRIRNINPDSSIKMEGDGDSINLGTNPHLKCLNASVWDNVTGVVKSPWNNGEYLKFENYRVRDNTYWYDDTTPVDNILIDGQGEYLMIFRANPYIYSTGGFPSIDYDGTSNLLSNCVISVRNGANVALGIEGACTYNFPGYHRKDMGGGTVISFLHGTIVAGYGTIVISAIINTADLATNDTATTNRLKFLLNIEDNGSVPVYDPVTHRKWGMYIDEDMGDICVLGPL